MMLYDYSDTFNDDEHVVEWFNSVVPDTCNDVFIDVPAVFRQRIASHNPKLVFYIMLLVDGDAIVKYPIHLYIWYGSCPLIWTSPNIE